jgi:hypothetical protein
MGGSEEERVRERVEAGLCASLCEVCCKRRDLVWRSSLQSSPMRCARNQVAASARSHCPRASRCAAACARRCSAGQGAEGGGRG